MKRVLKFLGLGLLVTGLAAAGSYLWLARDRGPTHPTLTSSDLAPLIPLRDFWANRSNKWGYSLSANGTWLSWWSVEGTDTVLNIRKRSGGPVQVIRPSEGQSARHRWSYDDNALILTHYSDNRWSDWRIDARDVTANWTEVTPRGFRNYHFVTTPNHADDPVILRSFDRSREFADIYTIDTDGHGKTLLRKNPGNVEFWLPGSQGEITLRALRTGPGQFEMQYDADADDAGWTTFENTTSQDYFWINAPRDDGHATAISNLGREHTAIFDYDLAQGTKTLIYEHPTRSVVRAYEIKPNSRQIDIVVLGAAIQTSNRLRRWVRNSWIRWAVFPNPST
ncbi:MAG: hypothetical protein CSA70_10050 [Rhodobacterales bacterium]|nr:MAG: hypothetical protein CSA70_10050 [Rhodobacterales bacterium]